MAYFAVINESGPAWDRSRPRREQEKWVEHAAFIDSLADEGFFLLVGPLSPTKSLLIVDSESEHSARAKLAEDPWRKMGILRLVSVEPWEVLVGKELLTTKAR